MEPMNAGSDIRALREERGLRPSDVERLTKRLSERHANSDYVIPHGTLNGIEGGATPTIYKLASLAAVLEIPIEKLLFLYGIDTAGTAHENTLGTRIQLEEPRIGIERRASTISALSQQTQLIQQDGPIRKALPQEILNRLGDPSRFSYAIIGAQDGILCEILPGDTFVEIDRLQNKIVRFPWTSLQERPIYCLWHGDGHVCCWCDQIGNVLTMVPHPLSGERSRQLRVPRDVTIIGRVTNSWRLASYRN
jgi:transcriptional regulator with XRE-family HTH domain